MREENAKTWWKAVENLVGIGYSILPNFSDHPHSGKEKSVKKTALILGCLIFLAPVMGFAQGFKLSLKDPTGDDKGPGTYVYPTSSEYAPGSFDLTEVEIQDKGSDVEFIVSVKARIEDPWDSKNWTPPGQGFSLQFVQIYVDMDHKAGSGHDKGLPGLNITFADEGRWEKVVLVSPQPVTRVKTEVKTKAADLAKDVIIPKQVKVSGKKLVVTVPKSELGQPTMEWGWQAVMQSNEGYPDGADVLTRDVNEIEGEHRFGGGNDWDCDPHALDILAGGATGADSEADGQYKALAYTCAGSDLSKAKLAVIPMVYPKSR